MPPELRPCPFCGAPPEWNIYGYYHRGEEVVEIACVNPACRVRPRIEQPQSEYGDWFIKDAWAGDDAVELPPGWEEFAAFVMADPAPAVLMIDRGLMRAMIGYLRAQKATERSNTPQA